ncbi:MAG TPA: hypothetical protein VNZ47_09205 [Candidatus Dormibacteraeota bacterium]|jgi:hypothetical protein|nr:hypothetical protein [Candidatus Dormibacteraeota bacterium]
MRQEKQSDFGLLNEELSAFPRSGSARSPSFGDGQFHYLLLADLLRWPAPHGVHYSKFPALSVLQVWICCAISKTFFLPAGRNQSIAKQTKALNEAGIGLVREQNKLVGREEF